MAALMHRWSYPSRYRILLLALLAGTLGLTVVGCDAATMAYFFMPEAREPAGIKNLASEDPKQTPKVAILTWSALETRSEFIHADRQLGDLLAAQLSELTNDNEEKLTIIPSRKVEQYKNTHPNWREDPSVIARVLEVDYLIFVEINSLSLYEARSANQLLRGRADLTVTLIDAKHPDDTPQKPLICVYPSDARGPVPAGLDTSTAEFRLAFLTHVAKRLSYQFARYPKRQTSFVE